MQLNVYTCVQLFDTLMIHPVIGLLFYNYSDIVWFTKLSSLVGLLLISIRIGLMLLSVSFVGVGNGHLLLREVPLLAETYWGSGAWFWPPNFIS